MLSGRTKLALINSAIQRERWSVMSRLQICVLPGHTATEWRCVQKITIWNRVPEVCRGVNQRPEHNNKFTETVSVENTSVSTVWARGSQDWQNFTVLVQSETSWWTFNSWSEEHLPQEVVETRTELKEESSGRTTTRNPHPGNKESNYSHL